MTHIHKMLIALVLAALTLVSTALAEGVMETSDAAMPDEGYLCDADDLPEGDEALMGYLSQRMGIAPAEARFVPRNLGGDLTDLNKTLYDYLRECIVSVAAGDTASTEFEVPLSLLGVEGKRYTAEDLGIERVVSDSNAITQEAVTAMRAQLKYDITRLARTLIWDLPYELYWFDKTVSVLATPPTIGGSYTASHTNDTVYFKTPMKFRFPAAQEYAAATYAVDQTKTKAASSTAAAAKAVVDRYAGASDYAKLVGYKETICELTDYNFEAVADEGRAYGDPWQIIWVFDGDESTRVACEGYAKAFQYLCDMTDFDEDICCYCVIGNMENEGHMWNIVRMPNGKNYHVDVTNCDTRPEGKAIGAPDKLFMVGCANGSPRTGYTFALSRNLKYTYKETTFSLFTDAELTLSDRAYLAETALPVTADTFPDAAFREAVASLCDADGSGYLSGDEIAAVTSLNVSGRGIASLVGIEYFSALTELNCTSNTLKTLDLSMLPNLTRLYCSDNPMTTLDITANRTLPGIAIPANRTNANGVKRFQSGSATLVCDLGVRLFTGRELSMITLPAGLNRVFSEAFSGIYAERIVIPDGCDRIGSRSFANCPNLCEVYIPASVSDIADDAFSGSPDVFIISPSASIRRWAMSNGMNSAAE